MKNSVILVLGAIFLLNLFVSVSAINASYPYEFNSNFSCSDFGLKCGTWRIINTSTMGVCTKIDNNGNEVVINNCKNCIDLTTRKAIDSCTFSETGSTLSYNSCGKECISFTSPPIEISKNNLSLMPFQDSNVYFSLLQEDLENLQSGGTIKINIKIENTELPKNTPIKLEIYAEGNSSDTLDAGFTVGLRVGAGAISGIIIENGTLNAEWLMNQEDLSKIEKNFRENGMATIQLKLIIKEIAFTNLNSIVFKSKTGECSGNIPCSTYSKDLCSEIEHFNLADCRWDESNNICTGEQGFSCSTLDVKEYCQVAQCSWTADNFWERFVNWIKSFFDHPPQPPSLNLSNGSCIEFISGHNNLDKHRVNLIFVGINFESKQFEENLQQLFYGANNTKGISEQIPFVNNLDKFNFWFVPEVRNITQPVQGNYQDYSRFAREQENVSEELISKCNYLNLNDRYPVILSQSHNYYPFHSQTYDSQNLSLKIIRLYYYEEINNDLTRIQDFLHEFGHSFGGFADEYPFGSQDWFYSDRGPAYASIFGSALDLPTTDKACENWCSGKPISIQSLKDFDCTQYTDIFSCLSNNYENDKPCIFLFNSTKLNGNYYSGCVNTMQLCLPIEDKATCNSMRVENYYSSSSRLKNASICRFGNYMKINETTGETVNFPHPYFQSHCIPFIVGDLYDHPTSDSGINIGTNCVSGTGCYKNAGFPSMFRASLISKMQDPYFPFNVAQQQIFEQKLNQFG